MVSAQGNQTAFISPRARRNNVLLGALTPGELLGALAHATTAELEALYALLVPLWAHATRAGYCTHVGSIEERRSKK